MEKQTASNYYSPHETCHDCQSGLWVFLIFFLFFTFLLQALSLQCRVLGDDFHSRFLSVTGIIGSPPNAIKIFSIAVWSPSFWPCLCLSYKLFVSQLFMHISPLFCACDEINVVCFSWSSALSALCLPNFCLIILCA
jgi:hypothetical protein